MSYRTHEGGRCAWSDLPVALCAHCRGDDQRVQPGEVVSLDPTPTGTRIWPPLRPEPQPTAAELPTAPAEADSRTRVATDLRAIRQMAAMLGERAVDLADDPHIPGGDAMVNLAPVANIEAWEHLEDATERLVEHPDERLRRVYTSVADEDPDEAWSPFQRLDYWAEQWRRELDMDYGLRPTISSEAAFLANPDVLGWARANERGWDEFVEDVRTARGGIENIVRDGIRETRSRVVCDRCTAGKRLVRKYGKGERADAWKCPGCKALFSEDDAKRAHAKQLRSGGAERWVEQTEAIGALRVQGWQERTVRQWIETLRHSQDRCTVCRETWPAREHAACPRKIRVRGELTECGGDLIPVWKGDREDIVEGYCHLRTRRVMLWWPSLWRKHLVATHDREAREA